MSLLVLISYSSIYTRPTPKTQLPPTPLSTRTVRLIYNSSVCCRSPIIPARPTFSATDMLNASADDADANIWTNPVGATPATAPAIDGHASSAMMMTVAPRTTAPGTDGHDGRVSSNENRIPDTIQRELDQRRIGNRYEHEYR